MKIIKWYSSVQRIYHSNTATHEWCFKYVTLHEIYNYFNEDSNITNKQEKKGKTLIKIESQNIMKTEGTKKLIKIL